MKNYNRGVRFRLHKKATGRVSCRKGFPTPPKKSIKRSPPAPCRGSLMLYLQLNNINIIGGGIMLVNEWLDIGYSKGIIDSVPSDSIVPFFICYNQWFRSRLNVLKPQSIDRIECTWRKYFDTNTFVNNGLFQSLILPLKFQVQII